MDPNLPRPVPISAPTPPPIPPQNPTNTPHTNQGGTPSVELPFNLPTPPTPFTHEEIASLIVGGGFTVAAQNLKHLETEAARKQNRQRAENVESAIQCFTGNPSEERIQNGILKLEGLATDKDIILILKNFHICKPDHEYTIGTDRKVVCLGRLTDAQRAEQAQMPIARHCSTMPTIQETLSGAGHFPRAEDYIRPIPVTGQSSNTNNAITTPEASVGGHSDHQEIGQVGGNVSVPEHSATSSPKGGDSNSQSMRGGADNQHFHLGVAPDNPRIQSPREIYPDRTGSTSLYSIGGFLFLVFGALYTKRKNQERIDSILKKSAFLVLLNDYKLERKNFEETKNILINHFKFSEEMSLAILKNL